MLKFAQMQRELARWAVKAGGDWVVWRWDLVVKIEVRRRFRRG